MALESGGFADKFGNSYEAIWVAKQLLRLAEEEIRSVIVEPLGDDETGVDLIVEGLEGQREFHQCKSSHKYADVWTLARLDEAGVLEKAYNQIRRTNCIFKIVSPFSFTQLSQLSLSAKNTTGNPEEFIEYQINPSKERTKFFDELCKRLKSYNKNLTTLDAMQFLKNFEVVAFYTNSESLKNINRTAKLLFLGEPKNVLDFLKNYPIAFDKLRSPITTSHLSNDMQARGFNPRAYQDDERVAPVIQLINRDFQFTIKPFLIDNILIERPEFIECIESLDSHPVTLIKAEAGMGKSAFMLQLKEYADEQGYITLPIRLDRNRPEKNIDAFGRDLGLSHSPVFSVNTFAGANKTVIILDQLDAIRWTANHSNNALQICREIANQVIQLKENGQEISLVLACRDFDLNEDPQLKQWISRLDDKNKVAHITLSALPTDQVKEALKPYSDYDSLSIVEQDILRTPLWLSLYLQIVKTGLSSPDFDSKVGLIGLYWQEMLKKITEMSIDTNIANSIIEDFIEKASQDMQFSLFVNSLNNFNPETLEALISVGVLLKHNNKISFQHQALFDYHLGKRLFDIARKSSDALLAEIGSKSEQTLTRREHIKYALKLLAQHKQSMFCDNISALLASPDIRFHIKYLAINVIREITDIKMPLRKLILSLIDDEVLGKPFIDHACFGQPQLVEVLSNAGVIAGWLNGDDSQIDLAIRLLSTIADKAPDIVLKEIEPFVGLSEQWNDRCYSALPNEIEKDSDEIFSMRKRLWMLNSNIKNIAWEGLIKKHPYRMLNVLNILLEEYINEITTSQANSDDDNTLLLLRHSWHDYQIDSLKELAIDLSEEILTDIAPKIFEIVSNQIISTHAPVDKRYYWLHKSRYSHNKPREHLIENLIDVLILAGERVSDNPKRLYSLLNPYLSNKGVIVEYIIANLMLNLSDDYANQVIGWLLINPDTRLACGNKYEEPKWILSGKLIEKFSPYCDDTLFKQLENKILNIGISKKIESIKSIFYSRKKHGSFKNSYWGEAQYFLLNQLDVNRVSLESANLHQVLQRRFESHINTDFYSINHSGGGSVTSPLPQPNTMSDRAWISLILTPDDKLNSGRWLQVDEHTIAESKIWAFARSLGTAVTNEPTRFAKLTLTLPTNINQEFIENIYFGLADTNPSNLADEFKDGWQACPLDLRYQVTEHFEGVSESQSLTRLLANNPNIIDYPKMLDRLIYIALDSSNPEPGKLSVYNPKEGHNPDVTTVENLLMNSINCNRGIAYSGIAKIFWENKEFALDNTGLIESAINDPHPAVNIVSTELIAPFLNYDKPFAIEKFLELCHKDLRMSCGRYNHYFFNSAFTEENKDNYVELVCNYPLK